MRRTLRRVLAFLMALLVSVNTVDLHVFAEELQITESLQEESADDEDMISSENVAGDGHASDGDMESAEDIWDENTANEGSVSNGDTNGETVSEESVSDGDAGNEGNFSDDNSEGEEDLSTAEETQSGWDGIATEAVYETEEYIVTFSLNSYWENGYNAKIRIENTGESIIENWCLRFDFYNTISNIWNACVQEEKDGRYLIKNVGWNQDIAAGESVEFGFSGQEAFSGFPELYCLQGDIIQTNHEDYSITYCVDNDWGSGFTGTVTITNNTHEVIEDWILEFDFNSEIISLWSGTIISHDENHYVIKNAGYNANIAAEDSVSFGFSGTYEEVNTPPDNFVLFSSDTIITEESEEDYLIVRNALSWLNVEYAFGDTQESVTSNVTLCKSLYGAEVKWTSSNPNLISNRGVVTRPTGVSEHITLTAQVSSNDYSDVKEFDLYVIKNDYVDYNLDYIEDLDSLELLYLYNDGDPEDLEVYLNEEGYISYISGSFSDFVVESPEEAILALYGIKSLMGIVSPQEELKWVSTSKDAYGTSFRFKQVCNEVPVYGIDIVVSVDSTGKTSSLYSSFVADIQIDTNPSVSAIAAIDILSEQGYSCSEGCDLTVFIDNWEPKLAWSVNAMYENGCYTVLLDAQSGSIVFTNPLSSSETMGKVSASGISWLKSNEEFEVTYVTAGNITEYMLQDPDRHILIHDAAGADPRILIKKPIRNSDNVWTAGEVSAITNVAKAYDFYYNNYGHKGLDGNGSPVDIWINYEKAKCGSLLDAWGLYFGHGGDYLYGGEAALDTVGHEYTHSVIKAKTSLADFYINAPGAINEGYADIFGYFIEGDDDPEWLHREDNTIEDADDPDKRGIRNMSNPAQFGDPSRIGDQYYYDFTVKGSGDDFGGVHHNSLIVSHACYLMWKNGITDKKRLADLWYHSIRLGYDVFSGFSTVRLNVLTAAKNMRMSADEIKVIKDAFDEVGIEGSTKADIQGTNILTGKVVVADTDMVLGNNRALPGAKIELARVGIVDDGSSRVDNYKIASSEEDGVFSFINVLPGNYKLTISKADYYTTTLYITLTATKLNNYCSTVELIPVTYVGKGTAKGRIVDSVTGNGVEGLTLRIRKGINAKSGTIIRTLNSGLNGEYSLDNLTSGHYCAEIVDQRNVEGNKYLTTYFNIKILGGMVVANQNATVSTSLDESQLRIVLDWGAAPRDLDSHLLGPTSSGGQYHIWYSNRSYSEEGVKMADLDLDDVDGYGPETTTIYSVSEGIYKFYVYNFSGSPEMSTSGASVRVYTGNSNEPAYVFNIPVDTTGRYWTVFTYNAGSRKITPVNVVGTSVVN